MPSQLPSEEVKASFLALASPHKSWLAQAAVLLGRLLSKTGMDKDWVVPAEPGPCSALVPHLFYPLAVVLMPTQGTLGQSGAPQLEYNKIPQQVRGPGAKLDAELRPHSHRS